MRDDVLEIINNVERLLRQGAEVDQFVPLVHDLVSIAPISLGSTYEPKAKLYRATKHHHAVPVMIDELWYPRGAKAALGRANRNEQPIFYCSPDPSSTFLEIGATVGCLAVHAQWVTRVPMLLHEVGYTAPVLSRAGAKRTLPARHQTFNESALDDCGKTVRDFLALAFTDPTSAKYSLTAAIAEVHLRAPEFSGLLYPAISKNANVDNIALTPEFVRKALTLEKAQLVKVDKVEEGGVIGGVVLCDLSRVEADGSLHWTFREQGTALSPGGSRAYRMRPGDCIRVQSPGDIQLDGNQYRVDTGYSIEMAESGTMTVRDLRGLIIEPVQ